jgi:multidrug efflux pump subunit AcrB
LVIIYLVLVAIFAHWGFPLLIMTAIPLGIAGGIVGLALLNLVGGLLPTIGLMPLSQPFDMITMLGFLILMGTVVNNPILVVDQARRNLRQQGVSVVDAVVDAVQTRLRPIAMTNTPASSSPPKSPGCWSPRPASPTGRPSGWCGCTVSACKSSKAFAT